ncbi:MAG TPA: efflux RND transporter periplasmic adaptor subunit [Aquabacterium sp.]|nr:efflux RND transporter periplasmic adaptor subunit [Aquabacterium sp.]
MNTKQEVVTTEKSSNPAVRAVGIIALLAAAGYGIYHFVYAGQVEYTDNAYVQANVVQVTPAVGGTVLSIGADDTDLVNAGQVLVKLDPADAQVAFDQAQAQLAQTVREVRTLYANNGTLQAQVDLRKADVVKVQTEVARAQDDVKRRAPLVATGAVGQEEYNHSLSQLNAAKSALAAAQSALTAAQEQLASNESLTEGTTVAHHPNVERAAARLREAYLALKRVDLVAPLSGYVAKRNVQVGQRVAAGMPLMSLVTLDQAWVDANFKESQLKRVRIGQPATLTADVYGQKVVYHGTVAGLSAGTGAAFSLLPAQNATGNWIKIVQRVPVRIALKPEELKAHPLRVGLSMEVDVDVQDQSGLMLAGAARQEPVAQTRVYDALQKDADALIKRIIAANVGRGESHHAAAHADTAGA